MLKKNITYTDYNGQTRTEDFYFNLSRAEVAEMELFLKKEGGLETNLKAITMSGNGKLIIETFKDLVFKSYGLKSDDGRFFRKSEQISADFENSEAYSEFFMELVTDADFAAEFVRGIIPANFDRTPQQGEPKRPGIPAGARRPQDRQQAKQPEFERQPDLPEAPVQEQPEDHPQVPTLTQDELDRVNADAMGLSVEDWKDLQAARARRAAQ